VILKIQWKNDLIAQKKIGFPFKKSSKMNDELITQSKDHSLGQINMMIFEMSLTVFLSFNLTSAIPWQ